VGAVQHLKPQSGPVLMRDGEVALEILTRKLFKTVNQSHSLLDRGSWLGCPIWHLFPDNRAGPVRSKFESVVAIQVTALLSSIALYLSIPKLGTDTATISDQIFLFIQTMIGLMLALSIVRVNAVSRNFRKITIGIMVVQIVAFPVMAFLMYYYLTQIS